MEACPTNLHTSIMGVVRGSEFAPYSPSRSEQSSISDQVSVSERSMSERSMSDFDEDVISGLSSCHTSYCISTMQIPVAENCSVAVGGSLSPVKTL